jgi:hypothetical protein
MDRTDIHSATAIPISFLDGLPRNGEVVAA